LSLSYVFFFFVLYSRLDARKDLGLGFLLRRQGMQGYGRNLRGAKGAPVLVVLVRKED
jgi:hypothetical protein